MKTKNTLVILIAVVFAFALLFSCILLFSVKKVDAEISVSTDIDTSELEQRLSEFCGDNLLFFNEDKVVSLVDEFPYFELLSVEKKYPNVIKLSIKERMETYYLETDETVFVTTADGFILRTISVAEYDGNVPREIIKLNFSGINVTEAVVGKNIKTDADELVSCMFSMAKSVNLTDCIKSVNVIKAPEKDDVLFNTYTGVSILITNATVRGMDKIIQGFNAYNDKTDDYLKTFNNIEVVLKADGSIVPVWTDKT